MPVDQTGENILFVMDGGYTEAHIQIQYDPDTQAEGFAWVVPISVIPEFSVGSEPLFQNILAGTVPTYGIQNTFDDCSMPSPGAGGDGGAGNADGSGKFDLGGGEPKGPTVVHHETVGAFEISVLSGGTASEVMTWLADNGYQQDPAAEPLLEQYLMEGLLFAAFKLKVGAEASSIHPVVLRFADTDEACIPIRLTRIAAADDMDIRAFFLADDRVVPENYRHVLVNPLKIDWPNQASNYKEVITMAVDAEGADGHAFVTEYAGTSEVVGLGGLVNDAWNADAFVGLGPAGTIYELEAQGLLFCNAAQCDYGHGLVEGLLAEYLPAPDGISNEEYWDCPECYLPQIDPTTFDNAGFVTALQERVIAPGQHGAELLESFPYLTRMYTTISPGEMTEDPLFHQNPSLDDVAAARTGTQRRLCNGDAVWRLPDGREVYLPAGAPWPEFADEMPWEEEVEEITTAGAPLSLSDRTDEIDALLAEYNATFDWPPSGSAGGSDGGGTTGGPGDGDTDGAGLTEMRESTGCACRSGNSSWSPLAFGLLVVPWLATRRRRRA